MKMFVNTIKGYYNYKWSTRFHKGEGSIVSLKNETNVREEKVSMRNWYIFTVPQRATHESQELLYICCASGMLKNGCIFIEKTLNVD